VWHQTEGLRGEVIQTAVQHIDNGIGGEVKMELKTVSINEKEQIFLDGEEMRNVTAYKLENSAGSKEPAKLTITICVNVGQVCSELLK
jgi:hypothetical protein